MNIKNSIAKTSFVLTLFLALSFVGQVVVYSYGTEVNNEGIQSTRVKSRAYKKTVSDPVSTPLPTPFTLMALHQPATFLFMEPLRYGYTGDGVIRLQNELRIEGYFTYPVSTGYFGSITQNALFSFQNANGLLATGELDDATRAFLNHRMQNRSGLISDDDAEVLLSNTSIVLQKINNVETREENGGVSEEQKKSLVQQILVLVSELFKIIK